MAVVIFTTFVLGSTVASLIRCLGLEGAPSPDLLPPGTAASKTSSSSDSILGGHGHDSGGSGSAHEQSSSQPGGGGLDASLLNTSFDSSGGGGGGGDGGGDGLSKSLLVGAEATAALEAEGGLDERDMNGGRRRSIPTTPRMPPRQGDFGLMAWFRRMDAEMVTPILGGKRAPAPISKPCCGLFESKRHKQQREQQQQSGGSIRNGIGAGSE
jgi:hypothetical protein